MNPQLVLASSENVNTPAKQTERGGHHGGGAPYGSATRGRNTVPPIKMGQTQTTPSSSTALRTTKEAKQKNKTEFDDIIQKKKRRDKLLQVLDILHELGIIHLLDKSKLKMVGGVKRTTSSTIAAGVGGGGGGATMASTAATKEGAENKKEGGSNDTSITNGATATTTTTAQPSSSVSAAAATSGAATIAPVSHSQDYDDDPNPIYCYGNGVPRMDVVLPSQILSDIKKAGEEVKRMKLRIDILRRALIMADADKSKMAGGGAGAGGKEGEQGGVEGGVAAAGEGGLKEAPPVVVNEATTKEEGDTKTGGTSTTKSSGKKKKGKKQKQSNNPPQPPVEIEEEVIDPAKRYATETLQKIYNLHPEDVIRDPVYAAALKMFRVQNVDFDKIGQLHKMNVENTLEMDRVINCGINFGKSKGQRQQKHPSGGAASSGSGSAGGGGGGGGGLSRSSSTGGGGSSSLGSKSKRRISASSHDGESSGKKKRKKGRPPKKSASGDLKQGGGGGGEGGAIPVVRANASWA